MTRHGAIIRLRPEKEEEYLRLHRDVWPDVLAQITRSNIRNFTIFLREGLLFSYFEYVGSDFDADMRAMADDPQTQAWWKLTDPCQEKLPGSDRQWSPMAEVFHVD